MCFPFFKAQGHDGRRLAVRGGGRRAARQALVLARAGARRLELPVDLVLGDARSRADAERGELDGVDVPDGWMGLDVGAADRRGATRRRSPAAGTVFWNGPMGAFELEPFAAGTRAVAEAVARSAGHDGRRRRRQRRGAAAVRARRTR